MENKKSIGFWKWLLKESIINTFKDIPASFLVYFVSFFGVVMSLGMIGVVVVGLIPLSPWIFVFATTLFVSFLLTLYGYYRVYIEVDLKQ